MGKNWAALAKKLYNVDLNNVSREEVWKRLKKEADVQAKKEAEEAALKAAKDKQDKTRILLTNEIGDKTSGSLDDTESDELKSQIYPGITFKMTMRSREMEDRWGGMPEQVALSEAYKIPIIILT